MSFLPLSHHNQNHDWNANNPTSPIPPAQSTSTHLRSAPPNAPLQNNPPDTADITTLSPPTNFAPFFTLLTSHPSTSTSTSNSTPPQPTTHHPTTHYIFTDDPPENDPITPAALSLLSSPPTTSPPTANTTQTKHRFILLTLSPTTIQIVSAASLSPDFAITSTGLEAAPAWGDGEGESEGQGEKGWMLRIEGREVERDTSGGRGEGEGVGKGDRNRGDGVVFGGDEDRIGAEMGMERLEGLVEGYERRLGELRAVVEAGKGLGISREEGAEGGGEGGGWSR